MQGRFAEIPERWRQCPSRVVPGSRVSPLPGLCDCPSSWCVLTLIQGFQVFYVLDNFTHLIFFINQCVTFAVCAQQFLQHLVTLPTTHIKMFQHGLNKYRAQKASVDVQLWHDHSTPVIEGCSLVKEGKDFPFLCHSLLLISLYFHAARGFDSQMGWAISWLLFFFHLYHSCFL